MKPTRKSIRSPTAATAETGPRIPDTRQHILGVVREMISERGNAAISLVDVATRAGVSRQTLYLLFGSRAGLLLAMVEDIDEKSSAPAKLATLRQALSPREAFEPYLRAWLEYLPDVLPIALALSAAGTSGDEDARSALESRMARLRAGFGQLTAGLHKSGALRDGWTSRTALDWIFNLTHVDTWHHLVDECGWPPAAAIETIVGTLKETLIRDR